MMNDRRKIPEEGNLVRCTIKIFFALLRWKKADKHGLWSDIIHRLYGKTTKVWNFFTKKDRITCGIENKAGPTFMTSSESFPAPFCATGFEKPLIWKLKKRYIWSVMFSRFKQTLKPFPSNPLYTFWSFAIGFPEIPVLQPGLITLDERIQNP